MRREEALRHPPRLGSGRWLFRLAACLVFAFLALTILPVLVMQWVNPFYSAFMLQSPVAVQYTWVDMKRISPNAALAVIAAEDQQFPFHHGFDVESIRKAVEHNNRGKRVRGASTISQQVAKNLFLWPGRSYLRKGLEAWFTVLIELLWSKERILEVYLNVVEFGKGVYGAEAAARRFYHKPAGRLSASEAALLAAVLPNPRRFRVERPSGYVLLRRSWILGQMRGLGGVSYLREVVGRRETGRPGSAST